jgi:hypothetical protein
VAWSAPTLIALLSLLLPGKPVAAADAGLAAAPAPPSVLLPDANIARAKALALDAALIKGWRVVSSAPAQVIFEIDLDAPASAGPSGVAPPETTLLRIRADFEEAPDGVLAALSANELWFAGTAREWRADVTAAYRGNLMNALTSLRQQWAAIAPRRPTAAGTSPRAQSDGAPASAAPVQRFEPPRRARLRDSAGSDIAPSPAAPVTPLPGTPVPPQPAAGPQAPAQAADAVGIWAYHAEAYAAARGCVLAARGAVLLEQAIDGELHRVYCDDGNSRLVRCDRQACGDAE